MLRCGIVVLLYCVDLASQIECSMKRTKEWLQAFDIQSPQPARPNMASCWQTANREEPLESDRIGSHCTQQRKGLRY
ncbi:hypothetical protein DFP73DRAFT_551351 [Morchella snyderi]|nr:hypothetical protein DFP73DRAFT_551351 [Morchella snyderi]